MTPRAVLELPRTRQAPGIARKWLSESFAVQLDACKQATAKLLVSELVTNAVVHGRGRIGLQAELDQDRLLVEVSDEGPGFTRTDFHAIAGHGLWIVDAEASRWGIREGTADIWFELERYQTGSDGTVGGATPGAKCSEPEGNTRSATLPRPTGPAGRTIRSHGNASSAQPQVASPGRSSVPSARSPRWPDPSGSSSNGRRRRAERAALYRRVADTLERSADIAERHAERERRQGQHRSVRVELDRAKRAREAARGGRALSSRLTEDTITVIPALARSVDHVGRQSR